jgi:signal transduction histidine kinase
MRTVAIIDDVLSNALLLKGFVKRLPLVETAIFTDPIEALHWCHGHELDLILLDYMMPGMNGIEFLQRMRAIERLNEIPVIVVTGEESKETLYQALNSGATDFLRKPVDHVELIARARNMLQLRARQSELAKMNEDVVKLNVELADNVEKLRAAQDEIVRKGKLAQLGQLTATVAHEIRNPLGAVRNALHIIGRIVKEETPGVHQQVRRMNNAIARCDKVITELLDFARADSLRFETVVVDDWLCNVLANEAKSLPSLVELSYDLTLGETRATFDTDQMERVVISLVSNAREALVSNATNANLGTTESPQIRVSTKRVSNCVEITITDNGPGISENHLSRVREPLFTTKSFGAGLGLPSAEKFLEHHNGGLKIASTLGEGTVVTAWFPAAQSGKQAA